MRRRQYDIDPPMGADPSRRHLSAMDMDRQEHGRRLDRIRRREPPILQPFEDQVGVQRMSPRNLRHRHAGR